MKAVAILIVLLVVAPFTAAQRVRPKPVSTPQDQTAKEKQKEIAEAATQSRAKLIEATKEYQSSLEKLLTMLTDEEKRAADLVEKRRLLLEQGVIAKRELEESERALAEARSKVEGTRKSIGEAEQLMTEAI